MDQLDGADMLSVADHILFYQISLYEQSTSEHMRLWAAHEYNSVEAFVIGRRHWTLPLLPANHSC
jgi:hypothetical protein